MRKWRLLDLGKISAEEYFKLEELLIKERQNDEIIDTLLIVDVGKHVWLGKNLKEKEDEYVDIDFCRKKGIPIYNGISDGGAFILTDGNLQVVLFAKESSIFPKKFSYMLFQLAIKRGIKQPKISIKGNDFIVKGRKIGATSFELFDDVIYVEGVINLKFNYEENSKILTDKGKEGKDLRKWSTSMEEEIGKFNFKKIKDVISKAFERRFKVNLKTAILTEKEKKVLGIG